MVARALTATIAAALLFASQLAPASASTLPWDVNDDCIVNVLDLSIEAHSYLTGIGSLLYSPTLDMNHDGVINILDIQTVAAHYNETC